MRPIVLGLGLTALAIWSAFAYVVHLVVDVLGGYGAANADLLPVPPEWVVLVSDALKVATGVGGPLVVAVWTVGAAVIALVTVIGVVVAGKIGRRDKALLAPDPRLPHLDAAYPRDRATARHRTGVAIGEAIGRLVRGRGYLR